MPRSISMRINPFGSRSPMREREVRAEIVIPVERGSGRFSDTSRSGAPLAAIYTQGQSCCQRTFTALAGTTSM